jgi:hypothetical protein
LECAGTGPAYHRPRYRYGMAAHFHRIRLGCDCGGCCGCVGCGCLDGKDSACGTANSWRLRSRLRS